MRQNPRSRIVSLAAYKLKSVILLRIFYVSNLNRICVDPPIPTPIQVGPDFVANLDWKTNGRSNRWLPFFFARQRVPIPIQVTQTHHDDAYEILPNRSLLFWIPDRALEWWANRIIQPNRFIIIGNRVRVWWVVSEEPTPSSPLFLELVSRMTPSYTHPRTTPLSVAEKGWDFPWERARKTSSKFPSDADADAYVCQK